MKKIFTLFSLLCALFCNAQVENFKLGYQEFPTNVTGQTSDETGNIYYSGIFKGELKVNDRVLQTGAGLEDIFVVKTNVAGNVIYSKTFGSKNSDFAVVDGISYSNNNIYLGTRLTDEIAFQSYTVSPYAGRPNNASTSAIVNLDTSGNVKWVSKTSIGISKVFASNNIVHVIGVAAPLMGSVKYNDKALFDSSGYTYMVHLMLDTSGNLINYKAITPRTTSQQSLLYISSYTNGKLCMLLRATGDQYFKFGEKTIPLPTTTNNYFVLIKTDTAYSSVSSKLINDGPLNSPSNLLTTAGPNGLPITLSTSDSVYMVLTADDPMELYYDGIYVPNYRKNMLVVLDSSLKAKRAVELGNSYGGGLFNRAKRRLFIRSINVLKNNLFFSGVFIGSNESPRKEIVKSDSLVAVIPNLFSTIDYAGSSKSFVAKTSLGFANGIFNWLGDHSNYETPNLYQNFTHPINDSLLAFSFQADNIWNPWIIDNNTKVISGSMRPNADMADVARFIEYLPDGSRIIIGSAKGKTALDTSVTGIKSNANRTDAFVTRVTAKGEVKWYKRFNSTLTSAAPKKLVIKDYKAYFLINYFGSVNDTNFLEVDKKLYLINPSTSLLATVDTSGNINALNAENNNIKNADIIDFNFFRNGDVAFLATNLGQITYPTFSKIGDGYYILRLDAANRIVGGRKCRGSFTHIEIDPNDTIYLTAPVSSTNDINSQYGFVVLDNGSELIDSIRTENNYGGQNAGGLSIIKMTWNKFLWYKRSSGLNAFGSQNAFPETFFSNNKLTFMGKSSIVNGNASATAFYWDKQLVTSAMAPLQTYVFSLNTSGGIETYKTINDFIITNAKKKNDGSIYISGATTKSTSLDTIAIGFDGGQDGLGFIIDSSFKATKTFRLATPYNETMFDFDVYKDSLATFAYTAQVTPSLKTNRTSVVSSDYMEDAFLGSQILKTASVLPLDLLSFTANRNENIVTLNWTIAQNEEGKRYIVQRSDNTAPFKDIVTINSVTGSSFATYTSKDDLKDYGKYYYRLKIISVDGKESYSKVLQVLYPPKESSFYYDMSSQQLYILRTNNHTYQYAIFDASGKKLIEGLKTTGNKTIIVSKFSKGQYVVRTQEDSGSFQTYQFIK